MDGRRVQFVMSQLKSNQWIEIQSGENKYTTITRDFFHDYMILNLFINDVILRVFSKEDNENHAWALLTYFFITFTLK